MGDIDKVLTKVQIKNVPQNRRFCIELCENIHIHYRNLRLEFDKDEFLQIIRAIKQVDEKDVEEFEYSGDNKKYKFKEIVKTRLPEATAFDDRFQVEVQKNGKIHVHFRNMRIELKNMKDFRRYIFGLVPYA